MNIATTLRTEKSKSGLPTETPQPDLLTETLLSKLGNPERSSDIDLHAATNQVLKDVGMSTADSGGKVTFYGRDPILGWMSARRCGGSVVSSIGNGKQSMDVPRSGGTPRIRSKTHHCFAKRGMGGTSWRCPSTPSYTHALSTSSPAAPASNP